MSARPVVFAPRAPNPIAILLIPTVFASRAKEPTATLRGGDRWNCPNCGTEDVKLRKTYTTAAGTIMHSLACKAGCRSVYSVNNKVYMDLLKHRMREGLDCVIVSCHRLAPQPIRGCTLATGICNALCRRQSCCASISTDQRKRQVQGQVKDLLLKGKGHLI